MYNLRYHIASLVAVFLSLTIGLLLGTIVAERGTLDAQRETLVASLERDFATLGERNAALSAENETRSEFVGAVLPALVAGRLEGQRILVLANAGRADGFGATEEAVRQAGGIPFTLRLERPGMGLDDPAVTGALKKLAGSDEEIPERSVVASLAAEWTTPGERPLTEALRQAGVIGGDELPSDVAFLAVVVLSSWNGSPDGIALDVASLMRERGARGAGIEALGQSTGVAAAAVDNGLSAVDHMGIPEGAYSLVYILAGEAQGYFGTGPTAAGAFPRLAQP
ncbi:MAG: copper transporter [Coriobacteriia bacterium]|nr:copper transporter [Coriobacteriia bacterium]